MLISLSQLHKRGRQHNSVREVITAYFFIHAFLVESCFLLAIGREVWIPKFIAEKVISYKRLSYVIERLLRASGRMERWFHPRMFFFATNGKMMRVHGSFVMLMGLTAAIPLPLPFNNLVAALPILLLGLSLLERDGILVIVFYLASIPCFIYYSALIYLGHAGFERLMGF